LRLPRDVSGQQLAKALTRFGYSVTRQTGSHIRLTSGFKNSEHHLTIPAHDQLKIGTLSQVLADAAAYLEMTKDQLARELFS
jgi:predicted RNA binding protein YcfA (HicA-like mRNA interferase family)